MKTTSTRRLRARAAAMNTHDAEFDDYGPEPNMKLSHAFLVVLLLHVIAVGGLYAFNSMKAGKAPKLSTEKMTAPSSSMSKPPGNSNEQEPNPEEPKSGPPPREKTPLVAKTSEAPKVTQSAPKVTETATKVRKGFLSNAKTALQRMTGMGAGAATGATAAAQETNPQATTAGQPAESVPATPATTTAKKYLVKSGDTITRISSSLGVTILDLEKANGMAGNAVLRVGQTLKVPEKMVAQAATDIANQTAPVAGSVQQLPGSIAEAATAAMAAPAQGASNAPVAMGDMAEYTVVKGDNPYKIAKKFKITPEELMKANNITDPKKIQIGQKLKIPAFHKRS